MGMTRWTAIVFGALGAAMACNSGGIIEPPDDDSAADDDVGDDDSAGAGPISAVSWRLHDELETLVYVSWEQGVDAEGYVEYRFEGDEWLRTPAASLTPGPHEQLLLGIPYETDVFFRVVNDDGAVTSDDLVATTGAWPDGLPQPYLVTSAPGQYEPTGKYLLGSINQLDGGWVGGHYWKFILDRQGRVVWAHLTPDENWTIYLRVSYDGDDILWDEFTYWSAWDDGEGSQVHRIKIDGSVVQTYATPGGHHAFTELADGSLVWGAATWDSETLQRRFPDGSTETVWDCNDFHDSIGVHTMCQSNSLYWHEATDVFLYSFYTTETVVEIDAASGSTLRTWGHLPGAWSFDPVDSAFWWQHGVTYTEQGTLLVSTHTIPSSEELAVREYELDEAGQTLHQVWSFGVGASVYGEYAGEAHRLPGGNTLHNFGSGARVREIAPGDDVVWDVQWSGDRLLGRTVFLEDLYDFAP